MSRPLVTDDIVQRLEFARACVLDQRSASHKRGDHSWDDRYREAIDTIDAIVRWHKKSEKKPKKKSEKKAEKRTA